MRSIHSGEPGPIFPSCIRMMLGYCEGDKHGSALNAPVVSPLLVSFSRSPYGEFAR